MVRCSTGAREALVASCVRKTSGVLKAACVVQGACTKDLAHRSAVDHTARVRQLLLDRTSACMNRVQALCTCDERLRACWKVAPPPPLNWLM